MNVPRLASKKSVCCQESRVETNSVNDTLQFVGTTNKSGELFMMRLLENGEEKE
jgi:hypothetical protein